MLSINVNENGILEIPKEVLSKMGLDKGGKLYLYHEKGQYVLKSTENDPLTELQKLCDGFSDEMGWKTDDDIVQYCKEYRNEQYLKNVDNG
jgi:bifunctional DNA-binding transcriptional regulator/antitoxin component of YhaV-PrlF toxin-antitoxin module